MQLLEGMKPEDATVVSSWLDDARSSDDAEYCGRTARRVVDNIRRWRRARHHRIAFGYVKELLGRGYSKENVLGLWGHNGDYFIGIDTRGGYLTVSILDKEEERFSIRQLIREAEASTSAGQSSLF